MYFKIMTFIVPEEPAGVGKEQYRFNSKTGGSSGQAKWLYYVSLLIDRAI
jgi:hypothetical protein